MIKHTYTPDFTITFKDGRKVFIEAKLQIDTRKWVLSRMNPKKYGDKQQMEHSGDVAVNMISELMKELSAGD